MSCRDCGHRDHVGRMCGMPIGRRGLGWTCKCTAGESVPQRMDVREWSEREQQAAADFAGFVLEAFMPDPVGAVAAVAAALLASAPEPALRPDQRARLDAANRARTATQARIARLARESRQLSTGSTQAHVRAVDPERIEAWTRSPPPARLTAQRSCRIGRRRRRRRSRAKKTAG